MNGITQYNAMQANQIVCDLVLFDIPYDPLQCINMRSIFTILELRCAHTHLALGLPAGFETFGHAFS